MSMKPETAEDDHKPGRDQSHSPKKMYLRFAAMILTAMVVMTG